MPKSLAISDPPASDLKSQRFRSTAISSCNVYQLFTDSEVIWSRVTGALRFEIVRLYCDVKSSGKSPINTNTFSGLSREWVGVKLVYVLPFSLGKEKHRNKTPRKSQENAETVPGESQNNPVTILFMRFCCL